MPQMGYDMQEGTLVRWLKTEGAEVKIGEPIAEIETDKAVVEFESYAAGMLQRVLVQEGATVPVGEPIALIGTEAGEVLESVPAAPAESREDEPPEEPSLAPALVSHVDEAPEPPKRARVTRASPVAQRLAVERGIDLSTVTGTGPGGRITRDDVLAAEPGQPAEGVPPPETPRAPAEGDRVPLTRMRGQIARVTVTSKQQKPHFYVSSEIDMTRAMEMRRQINEANEASTGEAARVTVNDLVIKACVEALKMYPTFNAFFQDDGIQLNDRINVGVAIASEEGLMVPAIMDCGGKSLAEIAAASRDLAERTRTGTLRPQEYTGGTFTISNLGTFEVTSFAAIIYPPQTAVLAVGSVTKRPVVREDRIVIAEMMTATLSADHRIVDGAGGARFIVEVKRQLENPLGFLLGSP